jgi:hypothetical protein
MSTQLATTGRAVRHFAVAAGALVLLGHGACALAAAPEVVAVPWRGGLDLPHEVYDGKQIHLKGIARNVTTAATASWDPGDGSPAKPVTVSTSAAEPTVAYNLGVTHTYPASAPGTPYTPR